MPPGRPMNTPKSSDRLDLAGDLVALLVRLGEFFPRIGLALLHAEADGRRSSSMSRTMTSTSSPSCNNLARIDVLVRPIHFGNVHETFDTGFNFNEGTVIGDVRDLAEEAGALRVAAGDADPRIFAELLEAERNAALFPCRTWRTLAVIS